MLTNAQSAGLCSWGSTESMCTERTACILTGNFFWWKKFFLTKSANIVKKYEKKKFGGKIFWADLIEVIVKKTVVLELKSDHPLVFN